MLDHSNHHRSDAAAHYEPVLGAGDLCVPTPDRTKVALECPRATITLSFTQSPERLIESVLIRAREKNKTFAAEAEFTPKTETARRELNELLAQCAHPEVILFAIGTYARAKQQDVEVRLQALPAAPATSIVNDNGLTTLVASKTTPQSIPELLNWLEGGAFVRVELQQESLVKEKPALMLIEIMQPRGESAFGCIRFRLGSQRWIYDIPAPFEKLRSLETLSRAAQEWIEIFTQHGFLNTVTRLDRSSDAEYALVDSSQNEEIEAPPVQQEPLEGSTALAPEAPSYIDSELKYHDWNSEAGAYEFKANHARRSKTLSNGVSIVYLRDDNQLAIFISASDKPNTCACVYSRSNRGWGKWFRERKMNAVYEQLISEDPKKQAKALSYLSCHPVEAQVRWGERTSAFLCDLSDLVKFDHRAQLNSRTVKWMTQGRAQEVLQGFEHVSVTRNQSSHLEFSILELGLNSHGEGSLTLRNRLGYELRFELPSLYRPAADELFERKQLITDCIKTLARSPEELLLELVQGYKLSVHKGFYFEPTMANWKAAHRMSEIFTAWGAATQAPARSQLEHALKESPPLEGTFLVSYRMPTPRATLVLSGDEHGVRTITLRGPKKTLFGAEQEVSLKVQRSHTSIDFKQIFAVFARMGITDSRDIATSELARLLKQQVSD